MNWVVYVDIDAYYVSCELRDRPELVGKPVIVGPDPRLGPTRGVVLSASYEARSFGVRSALPVRRALELCPTAEWLPADFPKYERISHEVRALLGRDHPDVLPLSIDEAAVVVDSPDARGAKEAAEGIQRRLRDELRLPSSLGVSPHRTIAKIASDRAKPGGIVVVEPTESAAFLAPLPVRSIPGVGPKTSERLQARGIRLIGDLVRRPLSEVYRAVGSFAPELRRLAEGNPSEAVDRSGPQSRSAAETFLTDQAEAGPLAEAVEQLSRRLADSLTEESLRFRSVSVTIRWSDFTQRQRVRGLAQRTRDAQVLARTALRLFESLWSEELAHHGRAARTISVAVGHLSEEPEGETTLEAFADPPGGHG